MRSLIGLNASVAATVLLASCATYQRQGLPPGRAREIEQALAVRGWGWGCDLEDRILTLDPDRVTEQEVREVLSRAPAPRIINIHGGIYPVQRRMYSFSRFLVGMGYPEDCIRHRGDGTLTFSCYESSRKIAGVIAWYYEQEGLRPMLVGHSQGGFQVVKVLYRLAGSPTDRLHVWSPLTWEKQDRYEITDPLTGRPRPVVGLRLPYVTALGAGGLTRLLPNQWDMCFRLRTIPDSVEEFTGFHKGMDLLGGDFLGYGAANLYRSAGRAQVRNLRLPSAYRHGAIPDTEHLLKSRQIRDWINGYRPMDVPPQVVPLDSDSRHILWAADVWYSVKRHWVLELQRLIQARRAFDHAS